MDMPDESPYLLFTPGPVSTSLGVRKAMLRDWGSWDEDYHLLVQDVRHRLLALSGAPSDDYTSVLLQGSGTFAVEAVIGSVLPRDGKLLVVENGAYGQRMVRICKALGISFTVDSYPEGHSIDLGRVEEVLRNDPTITHVALVHVETSSGILNPLEEFVRLAHSFGKIVVVDGMSSFGGMDMDICTLGIDFFISCANKCLQGTPGMAFVIAQRDRLMACQGQARSLSLDLYDQWREMEESPGKWRFTSPTHVVAALRQALVELDEEGGISARHKRYQTNQQLLVDGMSMLGYDTLVPREYQSPVITTFLYPDDADFSFQRMYALLKQDGFLLYPGKMTSIDTFRIGSIGTITPADIEALLASMQRLGFGYPESAR